MGGVFPSLQLYFCFEWVVYELYELDPVHPYFGCCFGEPGRCDSVEVFLSAERDDTCPLTGFPLFGAYLLNLRDSVYCYGPIGALERD